MVVGHRVQHARWLVLNKADLLQEEEQQAAAQAVIDELGWKDRWYLVSAIGRENTWPIMLEVMGFFDELKQAEQERADEAAYRAEAQNTSPDGA